ncbi:MAG: N-acetyltransferase family protein [Candidatus Limnocylindrales bacterium]
MAGDRKAASGGAPVRIRRALPADARAVAEIAVRGWQAAYRGLMPDDFLAGLSVGGREAAWREMLDRDTDGGVPAWLAERDGNAVGFASSGPPRDEDVPVPGAELYAVYVLPQEWRGGIGRSLMQAATAYWRERDATRLVLWVLESNARARAFYEALGWHPDGGRQELEIAGVKLAEIRYSLEGDGSSA